MRECLHVAGAGRLYSEASNVPHVARGRVSKVFVLIAYTIYIIGVLSAGPHVAVRSLFPAEMNVPHVACNVWLSGITDGFTYEKYILLYSIYAEPHVATCGTLPCNENKHLTPKNPNEYKKAMIEEDQSSLCVGVPGLEPGKTGPESVVLPITPYPKLSV